MKIIKKRKSATRRNKKIKTMNMKKSAGDPSSQAACSAVVVRTDPVMEAIARKLSGIAGVPPTEQATMIRRAANAGAKALRKEQRNG